MSEFDDTDYGVAESQDKISQSDDKISQSDDVISQSDALSAMVIMQMRLYDVLMALYTAEDAEGASKLYELHANGQVMSPWPFLNIPPESEQTNSPVKVQS